SGTDDLGRTRVYSSSRRDVAFRPWTSREIEPMEVQMPGRRAVAVLGLYLEDEAGRVLHRNFTTFHLTPGDAAPRDEVIAADGAKVRVLRVAPASFTDAKWSSGHWDVLEGLKVNGAGHGHFEYRLPWPADLKVEDIAGASFVAELGAKQLFSKDRKHAG